jgi:hypothetical protein
MKHLYLNIANKRYHSELCWCKQRSIYQEINLNLGEYEMMYPHEASDPVCRCEHPTIRPDEHNNLKVQVCVICGKILEEIS